MVFGRLLPKRMDIFTVKPESVAGFASSRDGKLCHLKGVFLKNLLTALLMC